MLWVWFAMVLAGKYWFHCIYIGIYVILISKISIKLIIRNSFGYFDWLRWTSLRPLMLISLYPFRTTMVQITHMRHDNNNSADDLIQLIVMKLLFFHIYYQVNYDYPPPTIRRGSAIKFLKLVSAHFSLTLQFASPFEPPTMQSV